MFIFGSLTNFKIYASTNDECPSTFCFRKRRANGASFGRISFPSGNILSHSAWNCGSR
jgi:hypothetical protein